VVGSGNDIGKPPKNVHVSLFKYKLYFICFNSMLINLWNILFVHNQGASDTLKSNFTCILIRLILFFVFVGFIGFHKLGLLCIAREEKKIKETCTFLGGFPILSYFICIWSSWNVKTNKTNKNKNKISRIRTMLTTGP
jgi:hypothetical protein